MRLFLHGSVGKVATLSARCPATLTCKVSLIQSASRCSRYDHKVNRLPGRGTAQLSRIQAAWRGRICATAPGRLVASNRSRVEQYCCHRETYGGQHAITLDRLFEQRWRKTGPQPRPGIRARSFHDAGASPALVERRLEVRF